MEALALDTAPAQETLPRPQTGQSASGIFDLLLRESAGGPADVPERPAAESNPNQSEGRPDGGSPAADEGPREPETDSVEATSSETSPKAADTGDTTPQPALQDGLAPVPSLTLAVAMPAPANAMTPVPAASVTVPAAAPAPGTGTQPAADPRAAIPGFSPGTPATPPIPVQALSQAAAVKQNSASSAPAPAVPPATASTPEPLPPAIAPVAAGARVAPDPRPARSPDTPNATATTGTHAGKVVAKGQPHQNSDAGQPGTHQVARAAKVTLTGPAAAASSPGAPGLLGAETPDAGALEARPLAAGPQVAVRGDLSPGQSLTGAADPGMRQTAGGATPSAVAEQVAVHIRKAAAAGNDRISIRLHPAELGRIQVKLDLVDDGRVRAAIQADRPETLDLMQRDLRSLERALQDAGLKTDANSLSFSLRDHDGHGGPAGEDPGRQSREEAEGPQLGHADEVGYGRWSPGDGRLDIRV